MFLVVIDGIVINSAEPLLDSALRQLVERRAPQESCGWVACWRMALESIARSVGDRTAKSILN